MKKSLSCLFVIYLCLYFSIRHQFILKIKSRSLNENDSKLLSYFIDSGWFFVIDDTKKGDSFDCRAYDVTVSTDQS